MKIKRELAFAERKLTRDFSEPETKINRDRKARVRCILRRCVCFELVLNHSWTNGENVSRQFQYEDIKSKHSFIEPDLSGTFQTY